MRIVIIVLIALSLSGLCAQADDAKRNPKDMMPPGVSGNYETLQSKVLKVFAAEDNGARFRAYLVKWKGQEVVVSDPLSASDYKEGDEITFMDQRVTLPSGAKSIKILQFMVLPFGNIK